MKKFLVHWTPRLHRAASGQNFLKERRGHPTSTGRGHWLFFEGLQLGNRLPAARPRKIPTPISAPLTEQDSGRI